MERYVGKAVLLGNSAVGKTSIKHRYCSKRFEEAVLPTIGVEYHIIMMPVDQKEVKIMLFDTSG